MSAADRQEADGWGWIGRPGRFEGDLAARLQQTQLGEKHPFRVHVSVWTWYFDLGSKEESLTWCHSSDALNGEDWAMRKGGYKPVKYFKSLDKAIEYLTDVRADAERRAITVEVRAIQRRGWETIA